MLFDGFAVSRCDAAWPNSRKPGSGGRSNTGCRQAAHGTSMVPLAVHKETAPMARRSLIGLVIALIVLSAVPALAQSGCAALPDHATLRTALITAVAAESSGLNNQMWA